MTRKPTMHDVARAAGVGTMTVSRVLNNAQNVAEETAARVRSAMLRLGYHPNEMARALRNLRSRTIGVIVPNLHDTFFATCAHAVNLVAREHSYTVLITTSDDDAETEHVEAQRMLHRHVEGLVVVPAVDSRLGHEDFRSIPVVAMDRPVGAASLDSVVVENEYGAAAAVNHLIEAHGHRRILLLGYRRSLYTVELRARGYERAMHAAGLPLLHNFHCDSALSAASLVRAALDGATPPTAIFCANNLVMRDTLLALHRLRLRVPEDMALVGFDDLELGAVLHPALTVVRQPVAATGQQAARLLFSRLCHEESGEARHITLGVELVLRRSCGCVYSQDEDEVRTQIAPRDEPAVKPREEGALAARDERAQEVTRRKRSRPTEVPLTTATPQDVFHAQGTKTRNRPATRKTSKRSGSPSSPAPR